MVVSDYILKAIEQVERNAAEARERIAREQHDLDATSSAPALASIDAELEEIERIERLTEAAKQDYARVYGETENR